MTADFNGGSNTDLAVANRDANSISILLGAGDGTFEDPYEILTSEDMNPRNIRIGDLNNDQFDDVVMVHDEQQGGAGQKYGVILGNGDGSFQAITVYFVEAGNGFPEAVSLTLGNFDGDDNLDLAVALSNSQEDEIVSYLGNGDGTFTLVDVFTVGKDPFNLINRDLNGDGFSDLLVSNTGSNKVTIHTNKGDGTFRNAIPGGDLWNYTATAFRLGDAPRWITMADVNGDLMPDLLSANEEGNDVSVLIADTDTSFIRGPQYGIGSPPQAFPSGGAAEDFNNDGYPDLAITNWGSSNSPSTVSVLLNAGDGTFLPKTNYTVGVNPDNVIAADFTQDGEIDLAVLNTRDSVFSVLSGVGDGTFNEAIHFSLGYNPAVLKSMRDMVMADFNEDNLHDIAIVNYNEDYLALFFGSLESVFEDVVKINTPGGFPERLSAADFNGDGHQDILLQKDAQFIGEDTKFEVYLGDGNGDFSDPEITTWQGENSRFILSLNANNDEYPDMIIFDSKFELKKDELFFFEGNGDGTFSLFNTLELIDPSALFAADVAGDENIDLLVGSFTNADVKVFEGQGNGNFSERWPSYGAGNGISFFTSGDFNQDGMLDLATTGGIFGESYVPILFGSGMTTGIPSNALKPVNTALEILQQNSPNPFRQATTITYELPATAPVLIEVFDQAGKKIETLVNDMKGAGQHSVRWNGSSLPGGIYFCTVQTNQQYETIKMVLLKN